MKNKNVKFWSMEPFNPFQ